MNVVWLGLARTGDGLLESALNSESQSVALERDQLDLAFGLKRGEIEIAVVELVETMRDRNPPMAGDAHLDLELVTSGGAALPHRREGRAGDLDDGPKFQLVRLLEIDEEGDGAIPSHEGQTERNSVAADEHGLSLDANRVEVDGLAVGLFHIGRDAHGPEVGDAELNLEFVTSGEAPRSPRRGSAQAGPNARRRDTRPR